MCIIYPFQIFLPQTDPRNYNKQLTPWNQGLIQEFPYYAHRKPVKVVEPLFTKQLFDKMQQSHKQHHSMEYFDHLLGWEIKKVGELSLFSKDVELPGFSKEMVSVDIMENNKSTYVFVSAKNEKKEMRVTVTLPTNGDIETLEAKLENGMLCLSCKSKKQLDHAPRKLAIK